MLDACVSILENEARTAGWLRRRADAAAAEGLSRPDFRGENMDRIGPSTFGPAEHLIATKALRCTATAWMLTVAESFA